jgi:tryptophan synthase alpha chain
VNTSTTDSTRQGEAAGAGFFADRPPGSPGLALFLNAGDPPLDVLRNVVRLLDDHRVDCLELAVPFPDSPTDGTVIKRSAKRALKAGVDLDAVLSFVEKAAPRLSHLKIALLADWSHSIKGSSLHEFVGRVSSAGADGLLIHGLPPRLRDEYYEAAASIGQPIVTTCYTNSEPDILRDAAEHGSAYIYLVSHYGRSGDVGPPDPTTLVPALATLRETATAPIAVGFGVKNREHIEALGQVGADAAIVGSTCVACVAGALMNRRDVVEDFRVLLGELGVAPKTVKVTTSLSTAPS